LPEIRTPSAPSPTSMQQNKNACSVNVGEKKTPLTVGSSLTQRHQAHIALLLAICSPTLVSVVPSMCASWPAPWRAIRLSVPRPRCVACTSISPFRPCMPLQKPSNGAIPGRFPLLTCTRIDTPRSDEDQVPHRARHRAGLAGHGARVDLPLFQGAAAHPARG
jgi:hypothetical protein